MPTIKDPVLLVQLTDSHLFSDTNASLLGLKTAQSLQRVIDLARAEHSHIDLLLGTGDLAQDGSVAAYQHFRQLTESLSVSARWIPGNHDHVPSMREAAARSHFLEPVVDIGNWRITLLHSNVDQKSHGYLDSCQLQRLAYSLSEAPERHHLIGLHHHPVAVGCEWIEPIGLCNAGEFWRVLDRYPQARAVLWGHVHQAFDQRRKDVRLLATPSTCVQFAPGSADFRISGEPPGYRWLRLESDGTLQTGVSRIADFFFEPDYRAKNY